MKTKNNVQKTNFKSILVVAGLCLAGLNLSAQKTEGTLLADSHIKNPKVKSEVNVVTVKSYPVIYRKVTENSLQLESWMVYGSLFTEEVAEPIEVTTDTPVLNNSIQNETVQESSLGLESWMFDANFWK